MSDPLLLISKHFYDTLTDEEAVALNSWIRQDLANARLFAHEAIVHHALRSEWIGQKICQQYFDAENEQVACPDAPSGRWPASEHGTRPRRGIARWRGSRAALVTMAMSLILCMTWIGFRTSHRVPVPASSPAVVELSQSFDAVWAPGAVALGTGPVPLDPQRLASGSINLVFSGGAEVVVEGPAAFQPISSTQLRLTSGRAVISCPTPQSRGFEVILPGAHITDLGTEFGVLASEDSAEVHVFEGSVAVRNSASGQSESKIFKQLEACRLTYSNNGTQNIPIDGAAFVRPFDLRLLETQTQWARYAQELRRDRDLVLWSDLSLGLAGQLVNDAPMLKNGVRILPSQVALQTDGGRHKRSTALKITDAAHAVQLQIPESFQNLTLAAWVKFFPERRNARDHRGILMSDGWGSPGQIHWQRKARDFRLTFPRVKAVDHARYIAETTQLDDGEWHLLVTVVDGHRERRVVQYLDGVELSNEPLNIPFRSIQLGNCTLGGWRPPQGNRENRTLNGLIDDIFIWKRALDATEVDTLYRASQ